MSQLPGGGNPLGVGQRPPPGNAPYSLHQRAVLAYATSQSRGGTLAQSEAAILAVWPQVPVGLIPQIADQARAAESAGRALAGRQEARLQAALGRAQTTPGAAVQVTAPVEINMSNGTSRWITVQVSAPAGTAGAELRRLIREQAQEWAEVGGSAYAGEVGAIGHGTVVD